MKKQNLFSFLAVFCVVAIALFPQTGLAEGHVDPAAIKVVSTESPLTIDGVLDETDWERRFDYLVFNADTVTGDVEYAPTGGVLVTGAYPDSSTTYVKFMHNGLDLYIALDSDDSSVCKFGISWEGDGLFMKIKDATGNAYEYKAYFNLSGTDPDIAIELPTAYPNSCEAIAVKKDGTIVNDTTQTDAGYVVEMVIHLEDLGYTNPYADVEVAINIFDPDNYSGDDDPYKATGSYYKQWWGSEWGSEFRTLSLADPKTKKAYVTSSTIDLDGQLNEAFWETAESVTVGVDDKCTGGYYSQWGQEGNEYSDRSSAILKFAHNGTDLYIGLESDDKSVCSWSTGWEADGLFLWMTNYGSIPASGERMEIKTMYFSTGEGDSAVFQLSGTVPSGAAEGVSYEPVGTVTHTETNGEDAGYSLEVVIHTADFDYQVGDTVMLSACVWDLDYGSADAMEDGVSDYAPNWWGSQWVDPSFEKYYMYRGVILSDESPANAAPIADAGSDQAVYEGDAVQLDGSGSSDADGDALTYSWIAPSEITLSDASVVNPTFDAPGVDAITKYSFVLVVNDGSLDSEPDTVDITVQPEVDGTVAHVDPGTIRVVSVENAPTIDGKLDETEWERRYDYLVFNSNNITGDVEFAPTAGVQVTGTYTDTTTTYVKIMHDGLDLYFAIDSDDESVCKFGGSWEGDGLFMKLKDANGNAQEFKLYFNLAGTDADIAFEVPASYPTAATAAAVKKDGTIVNDTTQTDAGYTAEMVIHLNELGYTDPYSEVEVAINIFDPDNYSGDDDAYKATGSYYKQWWGSEWGSEFRSLKLADPPTRVAYATESTMTLDGQLNEDFWSSAQSVDIGVNSELGTGGYYSQWGDSLNSYSDAGTAVLKFMHNGTDLYIGMECDDKSVCNWSTGWEADGLFLWMTNYGSIPASSERMEIKAMYFSGTQGDGITFQTSATVPADAADAASFEPEGTVTHTESNGEDAGYSLELVVHTADFGYMVGDTVMLSACVWDIDYGSTDAMLEGVSDYAPNWWGTQWVDPSFEKYFMYRGVILSSDVAIDDGDDENTVSQFKLHPNYPNPFNPTTNISFDIPKTTVVRMDIYNVLGQHIQTLVNRKLTQGYHTVQWNGRTKAGGIAPSGIYIYKLNVNEQVKAAKMVLSK